MYIAQNVDTEKALKALESARRIQSTEINTQIREKQAYLQGLEKGLEIAESIFYCHDFEKSQENNHNET